MTNEIKIATFLKVAKILNENNITWAVGASLLLYFKGITDKFNDIDLMVAEKDIEKTKTIFLSLGKEYSKNPNLQYKSKCFLEFNLDGIDFDIISGFVIVNNNCDHYFPLEKNSIAEYFCLENTSIPLQSVNDWLTYYTLMNRKEKVEMIKNYLNKNIKELK